MLTKNSTNAEIQAVHGAVLATGKTVIFSIEKSNSGNSMVAYLCQEVKGQGATTLATTLFLGWGSRVVRMQQRIAENLLSQFKVGQVINADILIEETTEGYDGQAAKTTPQGVAILFKGQEVYENASLVPTGQGGIVKLERDAVAVSNAAPVYEAAR